MLRERMSIHWLVRWGKGAVLSALILLVVFALGCQISEQKTDDTGTDSKSDDANKDGKSDGNNEYALATHAPDYSLIGTEINTAIIIDYWAEGSFDKICKTGFLGKSAKTEGFKHFSIRLGDYKDGVYPISSLAEPVEKGARATVHAITRHDGSYKYGLDAIPAYRGTVEIKKLTKENLGLTGDIEVHVIAEFAKEPVREFECNYSMDADMNWLDGECICLDQDEQVFNCKVDSFDDQCCYDPDVETETVEYRFVSHYCSLHCMESTNIPYSKCAHPPGYKPDTSNDGLSDLIHEDFKICSFMFYDAVENAGNELYVIGNAGINSTCPGYPAFRTFVNIFRDGQMHIDENWNASKTEYAPGVDILNLQTADISFDAIWKNQVGDFYLVGASGLVARYTETGLTILKISPPDTYEYYSGIWGNDQGELYVCGNNGSLLHMKDDNWSRIDLGTTKTLNCIAGNDQGEVVVAGENGVVRMFKDEEWRKINMSNSTDIQDVWFAPSGDLFAVSGYFDNPVTHPGTVWQFDCEAWVELAKAEGDILYGIHGNSKGIIYAVGDVTDESGEARPVVWKGEDSMWTRTQYNQSTGSLRGVKCLTNNKCYAFGDNMFFEL